MGPAKSRHAQPDQYLHLKERHGGSVRNLFDEILRRPNQHHHKTSKATEIIEVRGTFVDIKLKIFLRTGGQRKQRREFIGNIGFIE